MPIIKSYFLNFQKHIKNLQQALASFGIKMTKSQLETHSNVIGFDRMFDKWLDVA